jgi:hypothetical protein
MTEREKCRPLVAVDKRMILGELERVGCREFRNVAVWLIEVLVHRARQSGFEKALISNSPYATEYRETFVVKKKNGPRVDPDGRCAHSAKTLPLFSSALRSPLSVLRAQVCQSIWQYRGIWRSAPLESERDNLHTIRLAEPRKKYFAG